METFGRLFQMLVDLYMDERVDLVLDTFLGSQGDQDSVHEWVQKVTKKRRGAKQMRTLSDLIADFGDGY